MFPHLRSFSRSLGLQLHVVDLYQNLPSGWLPAPTSREEGEGNGDNKKKAEEAKENVEENMQEVEGGGEGGSEAMCALELRGLFNLALKEIRACQDMSAGPTFIVSDISQLQPFNNSLNHFFKTLLGQKYGHKPLPLHIPEDEYTLLCGAMEDSAEERQLVHHWYRLDSNALPPQYNLLQPLQDW